MNKVLEDYAKKYNVTKPAIIIAWILRHPAHMQPIFGTTKIAHLKELCAGCDIVLSREE
jgi:predicted oxidoreductase